MPFSFAVFAFLIISSCISFVFCVHLPRVSSECEPFHSTFPASSVIDSPSNSPAPFVAITRPGSYLVDGSGLQLYLEKPDGKITTKHGVNSIVADGATINSTFTLLYGKVTYEISSPIQPGVVTACILIADGRDEIDVEILGGDSKTWQTNVFAPTQKDPDPHYGEYSSVENVNLISELHSYSIDWNPMRIIWSLDGKAVRQLNKDDTYKNGVWHYPSHAARLQLGIWDASSPAGTCAWAKGPIDWKKAPERMTAVVRSVTVECPSY